MVALVIRLLLVVIVIGLAFYVIKSFLSQSDTVRCSRCDGKGILVRSAWQREMRLVQRFRKVKS